MNKHITTITLAALAGWSLHIDENLFAWVSLLVLFVLGIADVGARTTEATAAIEKSKSEKSLDVFTFTTGGRDEH